MCYPKPHGSVYIASRVTREMNLSILKELHKIWIKEGLLGDTTNLDFTTTPYWGESDYLENNWSGKRSKAFSSLSAFLPRILIQE